MITAKDLFPKAVFLNALSFHGERGLIVLLCTLSTFLYASCLTCFLLQVYTLPDISKPEDFKQNKLVLCIETVPLVWNIVLP